VRTDLPIPSAPYLDRRVRDVPNVCAIVFHHPDCAYFTADDGENGAAA
jgi:hypothetical protein